MKANQRIGRFRRGIAVALIALLTAAGAVGCNPAVSPKELGTPVYETDKLPGAGEPYALPEVKAALDQAPAPTP